jgi:hypothetical protein
VSLYLVWSNENGSWWGPSGARYTGDVWEAGRYTEEKAREACGRRTWPQGKVPPEVMVPAPDPLRQLTVEEIRAMPGVMRRLVDKATREAMAARKVGA